MATFLSQKMEKVFRTESMQNIPLQERSEALIRLLNKSPSRYIYPPVVYTGLIRILELMGLFFLGFITKVSMGEDGTTYESSLGMAACITLALIAFLQILNLYRVYNFRKLFPSFLRLTLACTCLFGFLYFLTTHLNIFATINPDWILKYGETSLVFLYINRFLFWGFTHYLTQSGRLHRRTVIVGGGKPSEELLKELERQEDVDLNIYGIFDDRHDDRSPDIVAGYSKLGTVDDLVQFARQTPVDLIIFTLPITAERRLLEMLAKLWVLPTDIRIATNAHQLRFHPRAYSYIGNVPLLDIFDRPIADWDIFLKVAFDKVMGSLLLLLLSPLLLLIALAVKIDSAGPIFFKQKRYGFNNQLIEVYKFRSMYVNQQDIKADKLVTKDDPRVTKVGRFLRRTSLDELPQLLNVVFGGTLSLVGPRPHAAHAKAANRKYDEVVDGYFARHRVKPGITGWAQVNGWRGETDTQEKIQKRVEHDLYYIENWSLFLDLKILLLTPLTVIKGDNAY